MTASTLWQAEALCSWSSWRRVRCPDSVANIVTIDITALCTLFLYLSLYRSLSLRQSYRYFFNMVNDFQLYHYLLFLYSILACTLHFLSLPEHTVFHIDWRSIAGKLLFMCSIIHLHVILVCFFKSSAWINMLIIHRMITVRLLMMCFAV